MTARRVANAEQQSWPLIGCCWEIDVTGVCVWSGIDLSCEHLWQYWRLDYRCTHIRRSVNLHDGLISISNHAACEPTTCTSWCTPHFTYKLKTCFLPDFQLYHLGLQQAHHFSSRKHDNRRGVSIMRWDVIKLLVRSLILFYQKDYMHHSDTLASTNLVKKLVTDLCECTAVGHGPTEDRSNASPTC